MQELVKMITDKVGLSAEDSAKAASTVLDYLKTKMPSFLHGSIDKAFDGHDVQDSIKDQATEMFSGAKEKIGDFAEDAQDKIEDIAGGIKDKLSGLFGK